MINPFGEDDDDYDINWLLDRHTAVSAYRAPTGEIHLIQGTKTFISSQLLKSNFKSTHQKKALTIHIFVFVLSSLLLNI